MLVNIDAEKLKQLRESRCWSQQQLADLCGLSLRTVQRIEAKAVASQESVKCLAATFDVPAHALFRDSASDTTTENQDNDSLPTPDTLATSHGTPDTTAVQETATDLKHQLRKLYVGYAIVFASHLFGFYGIFSAFDAGEISENTFQTLKNALSVVLIISAVLLFFKDKQLKQKHTSGSSL